MNNKTIVNISNKLFRNNIMNSKSPKYNKKRHQYHKDKTYNIKSGHKRETHTSYEDYTRQYNKNKNVNDNKKWDELRKRYNNNYNSLCIPCVSSTISKDDILKLFNSMDICVIKCIDEVSSNKQDVKRIFIHVKEWKNNKKTANFKNNMEKLGHVNIIYRFPLFWKCYISNVCKNY